ncbi:SDR family NAD(P)-dependent oxidoreductase [Mesonia ostreae]|uniref:SDR family NAD(P)-dependent oxidoreductase n=1 Tax=Mesonia ostreae TaxID=861110 RepID=A0ABU2KJM8_9FLAO|nr:SDR family NAD(P)-dependent oxidoreductase [Mesonia ostreae]MDT0294916.1 SDR family NAD(P)-dependent oxidoreductase [Mesonia ostreae]
MKNIAADVEIETGNATIAMKVDFTEEKEIENLVNKAVDKFGKISAVVNNVDWGANTPLFGSDSEKRINGYKLNTLSDYNSTKYCMPYLKKEQNASVVFSGSAVGKHHRQNLLNTVLQKPDF